MITVTNIQPKPYVKFGITHSRQISDEYNADIEPGQSIRIHGLDKNDTRNPRPFDLTFKVGDNAEYDSYNTSYFGPILAVTAKTVAIKDMWGKTRRLDLYEFCWRNWNFDLEDTIAENARWMD